MSSSPKISIDDIYLDTDNPRFRSFVLLSKTKIPKDPVPNSPAEKIVMDIYAQHEDFRQGLKDLQYTIKKHGVLDPIWLAKHPTKNGKYVVKEGNLRTITLKTLKTTTPPKGILYTHVSAQIFPAHTTYKEMQMKILTLQTGKYKWPAIALAAQYKLLTEKPDPITVEEISKEYHTTIPDIERAIDSHDKFIEYSNWHKKFTGKLPKSDKYSRINEAYKKKNIKANYLDTLSGNATKQKNIEYFKLISTINGLTKIKNPGDVGKFGKNLADKAQLVTNFVNDATGQIDDYVKQAKRLDPNLALDWCNNAENLVKDLLNVQQDQALMKQLNKHHDSKQAIKSLEQIIKKIRTQLPNPNP